MAHCTTRQQTQASTIYKLHDAAQSTGCGCAKALFPTTTNQKQKTSNQNQKARKLKYHKTAFIQFSKGLGELRYLTRLRGRLNGRRPNEPEPVNTGGGKTKLNNSINNKFKPNNPNPQNNPKIKSNRTQILAEIAIFTALSTALSFITFAVFPEGGSVTLGSMVPMLWLALRRGPKIGIFAGVVYGFVQLAVMPQIYFPAQILLDYPLAFGCLGIAGFFQKKHAIAGVIIAVTGRFIMHLISGALFFAALYAPAGMDYWIYSALYNGSYMLPELIISVFFIYGLQKSNVLKAYM